MKYTTNIHKGFTLVELVVVIAVIAILSTLIIVSLDNAKMTGRDTRRLTDIKQIQLALKLYYNDTGMYPTTITAGASIANHGSNYLLRVPSNPLPRTDNDCPNEDYTYTQLEGGQRYSLTFCLGDKTDDLSGGIKTATANGILDCAEGYVPVPGSATFDTNDFCVMKYEAKCVAKAAPTSGYKEPTTPTGGYDNNAVPCTSDKEVASVATGFPITNISQTDASTYCQAIGAHLMTNAEWMTMARQLEQVPANWDSGVVGTGTLQGIYTAGGIMEDGGVDTSPSSRAQHGLQLFSGQYLWHLANSVGEWTDDMCMGGDGEGKYYTDNSPQDWTAAYLDDYERPTSGPSNSAWGVNEGMGEYSGCDPEGSAFVRGGDNNGSNGNGLFNLDLSKLPATLSEFIGFRCVK